LKNLEATEAGLRRLFDKARTVSEMLAIQQQLTQVQGEIESLTAQIKVLNDQAAMATVTVQLVGPQPVVSPAGEDWGFTTALRTAVRGFVRTVEVMIVALGYLLPVLILVGLLVVLVVWLVRRSSRPRAGRPTIAGDRDGPTTATVTEQAPAAGLTPSDARPDEESRG
jgi:hypothetical protein